MTGVSVQRAKGKKNKGKSRKLSFGSDFKEGMQEFMKHYVGCEDRKLQQG